MSQAGAKDLATPTTLDETDFKNTTSADLLKGNVLADASVVQKVGYTQQHPLDTASSSAASAANLTLATDDDNNDNGSSLAKSQKPTKEWVKFEDIDNVGDNSTTRPVSAQSDRDTVISTMTAQPPNNQQKTNSTVDDLPPPRYRSAQQAAVLTTESVHMNVSTKPTTNAFQQNQNLNNNSHSSLTPQQPSTVGAGPMSSNNGSSPAVIDIPIGLPSTATVLTNPGMRTIELSTGRIREGFANGDIIVTLLPTNTKWPWITPAVFRPELVPEELMAQGLTLTVEEYVHAMETLVNDYRFTLYNICYKRILCCWILFAFSVLMGLLFSGLNGIALFSLGVAWLFLNASAIFLCMWMKLRLSRGLERCMASVNKQLMRHKIILVLDDRGKISCHKVNLCFMYFEPAQCVTYLNEFIARNEQNGTAIEVGWEARLDVPSNDIVIQGSSTTRVSRKQDRGELLLLRYAARWGRDVMRGRADVNLLEPARHCAAFVCPCQYVERHLECKPRGRIMYNTRLTDRLKETALPVGALGNLF